MDIVTALKQEESKLDGQLRAVREVIAVLNRQAGASAAPRSKSTVYSTKGKRTMSAAVRAKISRTAKARWAKIRAAKGVGKKPK
jgi:hypothetical protein